MRLASFQPKWRAGLLAAAFGAGCLLSSPLAVAQNPLGALQGLGNALGSGQAGSAGAAVGSVLGATGANTGGTNPLDLIKLLQQSVETIEESKEIEIGRQVSAVLLGAKPLHKDMRLQRYVNQLGRWLAMQSSRPGLPWTFAVIDDGGFNAFAAPGGYVFVTKGLIDRVRDEAELAGILAHEIAHVLGKHHLKAIGKNARAGVAAAVLQSQVRGVGGALANPLFSLGKTVYARGLDRDDEHEADRVGVALAAAAGYDPYGLVVVLQNLSTASASDPNFSLTMSTHPPAQARLDYLEKAMGNRLDGLAGAPSPRVAARIAAMK